MGVLLGVFFLGLHALADRRRARGRIFLRLAQAFGLLAAFALIMTGVFSLGQHASHSLWSNILYISFGTAAFFSGWGFLYYPELPRFLSCHASAVTWVMSVFNKTYVIEWVLVALK